MYNGRVVGVVIPALNEAGSIAAVVEDLRRVRVANSVAVDVLVVCDNGSTDDTAEIARQAGAQVVTEPQRGYGIACLTGLAALPAVDVVVFIDGDHSFVAAELPRLLQCWDAGADLVIGSRTLGRAQTGALAPQQVWGNRLASWLLSTIWGQPVTDLGPFRVVDAAALQKLQMCDRSYGWTVEMQIKALRAAMVVVEAPVTTRVRIGKSKVSGTLRGTVGAAVGILGTIARYALTREPAGRPASISPGDTPAGQRLSP